MNRRWMAAAAGVLMAIALAARPVVAEHFEFDFTVTTPRGQATSSWDTEPPVGGINPRPVVKATAGDMVRVEFLMRGVYPHKTMENVAVHLFVAREGRVGQKEPPNPDRGSVVSYRFQMDFHPDYASKGQLRFRAPEAGAYLVRITSEGTERNSGHEHFSAIDLEVEPRNGR